MVAKLLKRIGYTLAAILIACSAFIYYLLNTESGLQLIWRVAHHYTRDSLEISNLQGSLNQSVSFDKLHYQTDDTHVNIDKTTVSVDIWALLEKRLHVYYLTSNNINVTLPKPTTSSNTTSNATISTDDIFSILGRVQIDNLVINNIKIIQHGTPLFVASDIAITPAKYGNSQLVINSPDGNITATYQLDFIRYKQWKIHIIGKDLTASRFSEDWQGKVNLNMASEGIWSRRDKQITLQLHTLTGSMHQQAINASANLHYDNGTLKVTNTSFTFGAAKGSISGHIDKSWNLNWNIEIPELNKFKPELIGSINSNGMIHTVDGKQVISVLINGKKVGTRAYHAGTIQSHINTTLEKGAPLKTNIIITKVKADTLLIPQANIDLTAQYVGSDLIADANMMLDNNNSASLKLTLPNLKTLLPEQKINGTLDINFENLTLFNQILAKIPNVNNVEGKLDGQVNIDGTLADPKIKGNITLNSASFEVPEYKTRLQNITLKTEYTEDQSIKLDGQFEAGKGQGSLQGNIAFPESGVDVSLQIKGDDLQLTNTSEYRIEASPDMEINYANNTLALTGSIVIPRGVIAPTDFSSSVSLPSEVVIVDKKKPSSGPPLGIRLGLSIELGDDIRLDVYDLKAKVSGKIKIEQLPGGLPRASGELYTVDGTYKAYGRSLEITRGKIIYTGNLLSNPGLDIRATKRMRSVAYASSGSEFNSGQPSVYSGSNTLSVGVMIRGTIQKPLLTLFSDPPGLSQGDILSYMILGYPQSQASGTSSLALLNMAASSYTGDSAGGVTDKLQNALGLTELDVGSTEYYDATSNSTQSATTVNIGKDLGHNLSLHYNVGLFSSVSIFSLRYQLSKHFVLQSETSTLENAGDILYQFESSK